MAPEKRRPAAVTTQRAGHDVVSSKQKPLAQFEAAEAPQTEEAA
jgi:hypothetical protein